MLKRFLTASAALVVVAACGDTPVGAPLDRADPVAAFAKADQISICHLDADLGTYSSIMVNGNAEAAHRGHGDGQVGEPVPGMEFYEFDESCQPVIRVPQCLARAVAGYNREALLNGLDPWDWAREGPWTVVPPGDLGGFILLDALWIEGSPDPAFPDTFARITWQKFPFPGAPDPPNFSCAVGRFNSFFNGSSTAPVSEFAENKAFLQFLTDGS